MTENLNNAENPNNDENVEISGTDSHNTEENDGGKRVKHHLIKNKWIRRTLKTLLGFVVFLVLLPIALYIPPVQTLSLIHI